MTIKPLQIQYGGDHYKGMKTQPTEYWKANHLGGDESVVVSYVHRWRKKNGIEDLYKAYHHMQFILADTAYQKRVALLARLTRASAVYRDVMTPDQYIEANAIPVYEARVIRHITVWNHTGALHELRSAMASMQELIDLAVAELHE